MYDKIMCAECGDEYEKDSIVEYEGQLVCESCAYDLEHEIDEEEASDE